MNQIRLQEKIWIFSHLKFSIDLIRNQGKHNERYNNILCFRGTFLLHFRIFILFSIPRTKKVHARFVYWRFSSLRSDYSLHIHYSYFPYAHSNDYIISNQSWHHMLDMTIILNYFISLLVYQPVHFSILPNSLKMFNSTNGAKKFWLLILRSVIDDQFILILNSDANSDRYYKEVDFWDTDANRLAGLCMGLRIEWCHHCYFLLICYFLSIRKFWTWKCWKKTDSFALFRINLLIWKFHKY